MRHTHDIVLSADEVTKVYVTWEQDEPRREWSALQHLAAYAPDLAPRPLSTGTVQGRPFVVMTRLPGCPMTDALADAQQAAYAAALRRLFAVPVPEGLPVRANDPLAFQPRVQSRLQQTSDLGLCADPAVVGSAIIAARTWLQSNPPREDWIVDPVFALGDGNLDNAMWDGRTVRLVDWEEFGVSDLAYELAGVVEHASACLERRLHTSSFLASFGLDPEQHQRVARHRRMFASFWLAMLLPGNDSWQRNPAGSTEQQARRVLELLA